MSEGKGLVVAGRIVGVHGVRGELKLAPYGDPEAFDFREVSVSAGRRLRTLGVERARVHKGRILLKLRGLDDRNAAEGLVGAEVLVERAALPRLAEDEYYQCELLGLRVWTEQGRLLGVVKNIIATGGNDVYEVEGPGGEILIPAIKEVVRTVDVEGGRITVRLMEGLGGD
ncbi:MAG TPA: 16S rRNA processing protein RimM [Deltaproteobacteria bacterium]|nr:16S rRNA processing protein RimM [Deltaproteobacteria bacterium]